MHQIVSEIHIHRGSILETCAGGVHTTLVQCRPEVTSGCTCEPGSP